MGGKGSGRKAQPIACGTTAAYQRHRRRGEDCTVSRNAHAAEKRAKYSPKTGRRTNRKHRTNARQMIIAEKLRRGSCLDCGLVVTLENYVCFDFDHRDPHEKTFAISSKYRDVAFQTLHDEFAKCDLVCANCHRLRTHKQIQDGTLTGQKLQPLEDCQVLTLPFLD